jgi:hypothetical protein
LWAPGTDSRGRRKKRDSRGRRRLRRNFEIFEIFIDRCIAADRFYSFLCFFFCFYSKSLYCADILEQMHYLETTAITTMPQRFLFFWNKLLFWFLAEILEEMRLCKTALEL